MGGGACGVQRGVCAGGSEGCVGGGEAKGPQGWRLFPGSAVRGTYGTKKGDYVAVDGAPNMETGGRPVSGEWA